MPDHTMSSLSSYPSGLVLRAMDKHRSHNSANVCLCVVVCEMLIQRVNEANTNRKPILRQSASRIDSLVGRTYPHGVFAGFARLISDAL